MENRMIGFIEKRLLIGDLVRPLRRILISENTESVKKVASVVRKNRL
jgi:hypothetical protein